MSKTPFPTGFLWGTATSAHQVEGNNFLNDFWNWEMSENSIPKSDLACNQYVLYKKDFGLIKKVLNNNCHRISIEWSRIEPTEGRYLKEELKHYKKVIKELIKKRIEPIVTLHHFTNPVWFAKKGGWSKSSNVAHFKKYVEVCAREFGKLVKYWIVINEPSVYVLHAFIYGFFPPHKKSLLEASKVFLNLAKAHNEAYRVIHGHNKNAQVSSANPMIYFVPSSWIDKILTAPIKFLSNNLFLLLTKGRNDFIGVNHYFRFNSSWRKLLNFGKIPPGDLYQDMIYRRAERLGWSNDPEGIYKVIKETWDKYKIPILITENGVADDDDSVRPLYIKNYLTKIRQAISEGVNVFGYLHWSLLDNYEWGMGNSARFGLFETDFVTQKRKPRKSAYFYAEIAKTNGANL